MLGGDGPDLAGQLGAADGFDLVGVDLGPQAVFQAGFQHLAGLLRGEGVGFAEHVAVFGDALFLHLGHHLLADQPDVLRPVGLVLGGHQMGPHKGGHDVHGVAVVEVFDHLQGFQLMLSGQAVAALGLAGGDAKAHHLVQSPGGLLGQLFLGGLAGGVGGGLNAAPGVLDLQIGLAVELQAQLVLPPAAENQVGVGVHQAGGGQLALGVDGPIRRRGGAGPHLGDDAVLHQDPGVLEDLDFPLLRALSGAGTTGGGQHADVGDNGFHVVLLSVIGYKRDAEPLPYRMEVFQKRGRRGTPPLFVVYSA